MHGVNDSGPFDDDDDLPEGFDFANLFGQGGDPNQLLAGLMQLFGGAGAGAGGLNNALNVAVSIATGGKSEPNVDPIDRMSLEQLVRVAELQIGEATGLRTSTAGPLTIVPVTKADWVRKSMVAYKPVLEQLAAAMASPPVDSSDPQMMMLEQMFSAMRPMMVNMTTGSMVGHLGSGAIGTYDLPLPRPGNDELLVVVSNLDEFGNEWSLDKEELRMWIALSEVAHHAVLSVPHVAKAMSAVLGRYTNAFRNDPTMMNEAFDGLGELGDLSDLAGLQARIQEAFGDPMAMLGSMRSPEQEAILPELDTLVAVVVGYVDHIMDEVGTKLISNYAMLTEALRRRRVTTADSDRFVQRLLGLDLDQEHYERGRTFIDGIVERSDRDALSRLWQSEEALPTPTELTSPGLWLSRMDIDFEVEIDPAELAALDDFLNEQSGSEEE